MRHAFAIAGLLFLGALHAGAALADDDQGPFVGTLGKSAIVLRLYKDDNGQPVGRYFYRSQGIDIGLIARNAPGEYMECPLEGGNTDPQACEQPTGYWTLSVKGDNVIGTWRKTLQAAQTLSVTLARQCNACANASYPSDAIEKAYAQLRAEGPTHLSTKPSTSDDGSVTWQWLQEKRSGATIPQLVKAPVADAMQRINDELKRRFAQDIDAALSAKPDGESSCQYTVPFADARLFVVDAACEWDIPGAAHPSSSWGTVTYDLTTGNPVDWTQWLRFPDAAAKTFDFTTGNDIVSATLRHGAHFRNKEGCTQVAFESNGCEGNVCSNYGHDGDWKDAIGLSPRKDGMFVTLNNYPEVARECRGEGFTMPWDAIRALQTKPRVLP
jgi:hypothetical protein